MDKWKEELKMAFDAPCPVRKKDFLRRLDRCEMPVYRFLLSQVGYIRKWVWCVSVLIFGISVLGLAILPGTVLWMISGLTPLLALTIISEGGRSEVYNMAELEMATRFSLRSVTLARLVILGVLNLLLLGGLLPIGLWNDEVAPLAAILYIITPFLLSAYIGLCLVRKIRGKEGIYICGSASVGISIFLCLSHSVIPCIYREQWLAAWLLTALALLFGIGKQCVAMINKTEELSWNLS